MDQARSGFERVEPRRLFYRTAIILKDFILRGTTCELKISDALAALVQT